jgi:lipopolysaccharide/colanic/teichoic acid biosynthesis glycosyltransferase
MLKPIDRQGTRSDDHTPSRRVGLQRTEVKRPPSVLTTELFRTAIERERKRVERSKQPFALLLVSIDRRAPLDDASDLWVRAICALAFVKRRSDVLGWFAPAVVGILFPDIQGSLSLRAFRRRFQGALERHLGSNAYRTFSLRLHVHSGRLGGAEEDPCLIGTPRPRADLVSAAVYLAVKRASDVAGSLILLIALLPVLLLIAILVKLNSQGPVLFRQVRVGHRGKPFTLFKFRTMRAGADPSLHERFVSRFIRSSQGVAVSPEHAPFKLTNDPRVTPVGHFLRRTSLDELPQLWNVLRGEMSLVGPRPPLEYELKHYEPWHRRRVMEVKPGITGLWQVDGRSRTTFDQMVRLDLRYAKTCSFWSDIRILLATPAAVLSGRGAR